NLVSRMYGTVFDTLEGKRILAKMRKFLIPALFLIPVATTVNAQVQNPPKADPAADEFKCEKGEGEKAKLTVSKKCGEYLTIQTMVDQVNNKFRNIEELKRITQTPMARSFVADLNAAKDTAAKESAAEEIKQCFTKIGEAARKVDGHSLCNNIIKNI